MGEQVEWDIDANLPLYTRDYMKLLYQDGFHDASNANIRELLDKQRSDRDDQPTDIFSPEYDAWFRRYYDVAEGDHLTPREEFEKIFGPISADQWQWLKEFVRRHPVT